MAYPTWPTSLSQRVQGDSFTYNFGDTTLRSANDVGPAKVRRRSTKGVDTMTFSIIIDMSDYGTVVNFYRTDTNGGVKQFYFIHPLTQAQVLLRFTKPPVISPIGGRTFKVLFETEILPS